MRRIRRLAAWSAVIIAAVCVALAVGLLWRPSGAKIDGPRATFLAALANSEILPGQISLWSKGHATITITEGQLGDLAAAALNRADATVLPPVSRAVARSVPGWVESVSGCEISGEDVTMYVRCRKVITFYVTVSGRLAVRENGSLAYSVGELRVGLLPVARVLLGKTAASAGMVLLDPMETQFSVVGMSAGDGQFTLELETIREVHDVRQPV